MLYRIGSYFQSTHFFCPLLSSHRGSSGTAGETFPHRNRATGSEDQGLSERVLLRSVFVRHCGCGDMSDIFSYIQDTETDPFHM